MRQSHSSTMEELLSQWEQRFKKLSAYVEGLVLRRTQHKASVEAACIASAHVAQLVEKTPHSPHSNFCCEFAEIPPRLRTTPNTWVDPAAATVSSIPNIEQ